MRVNVKMPRAADTVDEVVVSEWVVAEGSTVAEGDPILRVVNVYGILEVL